MGMRLDILGPIPWLAIPNNSGQSDRSPLGHVATENHAQTSYMNKGIDTCVYDTGVKFQGVGGPYQYSNQNIIIQSSDNSMIEEGVKPRTQG